MPGNIDTHMDMYLHHLFIIS
uniref:Uncharacterized protein n=1 Tax=Moniliophthora roreri TaxID=221103 RepID=A0A0W0FDR3_MONRR